MTATFDKNSPLMRTPFHRNLFAGPRAKQAFFAGSRARLLLLAVFFAGNIFSLTAQVTQTSFGKNRVQYGRQFDEWMYYETANYVTYWYGDARNIAQSALQMAELDFNNVQQMLEHQVSEKIEVLVFTDLTDLKQSNIGEDEVFQLRSGETKVLGNKVFVYFDGNHQHLRAQLREGTAGVILNSMLYGSNFQEIVQNAVLLNLPGWFTDGLTAYCGEPWSVDLDNEFRDIVLSKRYKNFDKLAKDHPRLAGHAFWYYLDLHFGKGTVSNLLYLTRINRSVDAGFLYVLGGGYRRTTDSMLDYFRQRYSEESKYTRPADADQQIKIRNKRNLPLTQLKISPDGKRIAWVSNDIGRWKVWVQDLQTGKRKRILRGGTRNALQATDYNYPLLAWNPDNQRLAVLWEHRALGQVTIVDLQTGKKERTALSREYQRVYSMDYINPVDLVLSASSRGFADLFIYHTMNRQTERLTQDFWDDLDASVTILDGRKGVLFASNRLADTLSNQRLDTILPLGNFDVFWFDLESRSPELIRLTNTPWANERNPVGTDSTHFAYLSDISGVSNRQSGYLEEYVAFHKAVVYLHDGAEVSAWADKMPGEWPAQRIQVFLAPLDTVLKNVDSTLVDSVRFFPVLKKRPQTYNQTNSDRNIDAQDVSFRTGRLVESQHRDGKDQFFVRPCAPLVTSQAGISRYRELRLRAEGLPVPPQPAPQQNTTSQGNIDVRREELSPATDSVRPIPPGWLFQVPDYLENNSPSTPPSAPVADETRSERPSPRPDSMIVAPTEAVSRPRFEFGKNQSIIRFNPAQITPYRLKFRTDYVSTDLDNNLLFEGLDSYAGSPDGFRTPPPGILLRANFKDLLEDYVIEAGFRLPTTFNGAEYYLWFDNKKHRLDRRVALYRKSVVNTVDETQAGGVPQPYQVRTNTILGQYEVRYPLDVFFSLRGTFTLRQDKAITLTTDQNTLNKPDLAEQRAALRLAAVYDNTVEVDMNIRTGTRAKVFVEGVKRFEFNTQPDWSLSFNKGFMTVIGLDARHYQMLDRRSILALRLAGGTTFGSEKILYYLGGVDNWIFPQFNNNIPVPQNDDFAYQTLAANLRGFKQNIRNGNSYALLNAELRVPIFKYLSKKPVLGPFWRNFQLVGFFDAGTAWYGKDPYAGDNPLNTVTFSNPPTVSVTVNYFRDPLVAGYGVGMRTLLFGMYLRLDYGWGIETRVIQKPIAHIALGTDF